MRTLSPFENDIFLNFKLQFFKYLETSVSLSIQIMSVLKFSICSPNKLISSCRSFIDDICQLSMYCLSFPNPPFSTCPAIMELDPVHSSPLPADTMLSFASLDTWRGTGEESSLSSSFQCALSGGSCKTHGF